MLLPKAHQVIRKQLFAFVLQNDGATSDEVASLFRMSPGAASQLLKRLHRQGWLHRERGSRTEYFLYTPSPKLYERFDSYPFGEDHLEDNRSLLYW